MIMGKYLSLSVIVLMLFLLPITISAQSIETDTVQRVPQQRTMPYGSDSELTQPPPPPRDGTPLQRPQRLPEFEATTEDTGTTREQMRQDRQEIQDEFNQRRDEMNEQIEDFREEGENTREEINQQRQEFQEQRQEMIGTMCERVETMVDTRIARFDNNYERNLNRYQAMFERLQTIIEAFSEQGYDTSQLEAAVGEMESQILTVQSEYELFIEQLRASQEYACGESDGEFRNAISEARGQMRAFRQASSETRTFYQTEIRPLLLDLRQQVEADRGEPVDTQEAIPPMQQNGQSNGARPDNSINTNSPVINE